MTKQTAEAATETAETKKISLPEKETEALLAQIDTAIEQFLREPPEPVSPEMVLAALD